MITEEKRLQIQECIQDGDWGFLGDEITRNDMMEYLLYYTNPTISETGIKIKKLPKVQCPLCGTPISTQPFSMTCRAAYYLMCAQWLSKESLAKGGDGYVHYQACNDKLQGNFKHGKGIKYGAGYSFTSYSILMKAPWDFLQPRIDSNDKAKRDGYFKPTSRCLQFLRGEIAVPLRIERLNSDVVRYSRGLIYVAKVRQINWQQALEIYKTF